MERKSLGFFPRSTAPIEELPSMTFVREPVIFCSNWRQGAFIRHKQASALSSSVDSTRKVIQIGQIES